MSRGQRLLSRVWEDRALISGLEGDTRLVRKDINLALMAQGGILDLAGGRAHFRTPHLRQISRGRTEGKPLEAFTILAPTGGTGYTFGLSRPPRPLVRDKPDLILWHKHQIGLQRKTQSIASATYSHPSRAMKRWTGH
ncbi:hypothetical protein AAG570_001411 [Ranatra chinensis]|uniref:Uncharacterized protein n=1 Tax=Ranatra chinensis TaxID=642074 RepID=A0ABD0YBU6_9HEMI